MPITRSDIEKSAVKIRREPAGKTWQSKTPMNTDIFGKKS